MSARKSAAGVKIAVVDSQPLFRTGVISSLAASFVCVAEGRTAHDAIAIAGASSPDILLADVMTIDGGGVAFVTEFRRRWPGVKIVVLTCHEAEADVASALQSGVSGYVLKDVTAVELNAALNAVVSGVVYLSPTLGARLLAKPAAPMRAPVPAGPANDLTRREIQILEQVAVGATNREIAKTLSITEKTVKHYMTNIMQKLQVRNRVEAVLALGGRLKAA